MNHIPFADLPAAEREALLGALVRSGVSPRVVCVSKTEPASAADGGGGGGAVATVTAPGWFRSYQATSGWIALLERDLAGLRG